MSVLIPVVLMACSDQEKPQPDAVLSPSEAVEERALAQSTSVSARAPGEPVFNQFGTGQFFNPRAAVGELPPPVQLFGEGEYTITLIDVPIEQAAKAVLGDTLGLTFVVAPGVEGNISVQTSRPIGERELFEIFETALSLYGYAIAQKNGTYVISQDAIGTERFRIGGRDSPAVSGVFVLPLRFVSATQMTQLLQPVLNDRLSVQADVDRNLLFVSGSRQDVTAIFDAVNLFDVDSMRGKSIGRYSLISADPVEVATELSIIFDNGPGGPLEGVIDFVPNESLSSILVITTNPRYLSQAQGFIRSYDRDSARSRRIARVYPLRNRSAVDLAEVLSEMLSVGAVGTAEAGAPAGEGTTDGAAAGGEVVDAGAGSQDQARVVADDTSNAVIVYANALEQQSIAKLIRELDDVADQVLIEATIAEVTLNDQLDFGVRYFFESGNFDISFNPLEVLGSGPVFPGFNALFDDGNAIVALNALATLTDVNIVSSPSLMVLDNREAQLNVGDEVPIATRTSVSTDDPDAPIVSEIEQRDTGVILNIKPRVSATGRVILNIRQEVSNVIATDTSGIESPTIQERIVETTVAVDEGQSVVLGGLIRETRSVTRDKVPFLGDIPLLGVAFRSTSDQDRRTELLIVIRPRVIRNSSEAAEVAREYRDALSRPGSLINKKPQTPGHQFRRIFY
ncbi:MAG: type II secretion system secretin GspD [Pseudomonadota bacterium]